MDFSPDGTPLDVWRDGELHQLVPQDDGTFMEFDFDGVPLGTWSQNSDGEWEFEPFIPLGVLASTGELSVTILLALMGLLLVTSGAVLRKTRKAAR